MKTAPRTMRKVIRTEIGPTMITNLLPGRTEPPPGEPWRAFLFVQPVYDHKGSEKRGQVHVEVLEASTSDALDQELVTYAEKPGRVVLEEGFELRHFRSPSVIAVGAHGVPK